MNGPAAELTGWEREEAAGHPLADVFAVADETTRIPVAGVFLEFRDATVAEGVETRGQLQRLRSHGCSEAQGYLFSKPRPAGEIAAMLASFDAPASAAG